MEGRQYEPDAYAIVLLDDEGKIIRGIGPFATKAEAERWAKRKHQSDRTMVIELDQW